MFFEADGQIYVEYTSSSPKRTILKADIESSDSYVLCECCHVSGQADNSYEKVFGELRGSACPILWNGTGNVKTFLSIDHSKVKVGPGKTNYEACAHEFDATYPFKLKSITNLPILLREIHKDDDKALQVQLNPAVHSVVYPCGSLVMGDKIIISYGINDEKMALSSISSTDLRSNLLNCQVNNDDSLPSEGTNQFDLYATPKVSLLKTLSPDDFTSFSAVDLFWWDCQNKNFDKFSGRKWQKGNFGDITSKFIIEEVFKVPTNRVLASHKQKLLSTGSILQNACEGDVVWGSGLKKGNIFPSGIKNLDVYAVRGL